MSLSYDDADEIDAAFAELIDADLADVTDVGARFVLPDVAEDALEFDLRTPSRWSDLPRPSAAPSASVVGVEPYLVVDDAAAAIEFYARAFGGTERARETLADGRVLSAAIAIGSFTILVSDDFPELRCGRAGSPRALGGTPVTLHLTVDGVDRLFAQATRAGARVAVGLSDVSAQRRHGVLEDPFGHRWSLSSPAPS